jgi:hypothetical protein
MLFVILEPDETHIVVRVMDYDFGKKDDILGEIIVNINEAVNKGNLSFNLTRNGKPEKGVLVANFMWVQNRGGNCLQVCVCSVAGLRKGDWVGKNDVYCQIYPLPFNKYVEHKALPEPDKFRTLPASTLNVDFAFTLPKDLPSTISHGSSYITYSIYSNIDISWRKDPCTRKFFTVIQPIPAAAHLNPIPINVNDSKYLRVPCIPFVCRSCPLVCVKTGDIKFDCTMDASGYAAGETITLQFKNMTIPITSITSIQLIQKIILYAEGRTTYREEYLANDPLSNVKEMNGVYEVRVLVPSIPPTFQVPYHDPQSMAYFRTQPGAENRFQYISNDPIRWSYVLRINVAVPDDTCTCYATNIEREVPITICGIGRPIPVMVNVPCWYYDPNYMNMIQQAFGYTQYTPAVYPPQVMRDPQYDCTSTDASLNYQPTYLSWQNAPAMGNNMEGMSYNDNPNVGYGQQQAMMR